MTTTEQAIHPPSLRMSEEDFEAWVLRENVRAEWVQGEVILMSPVNTQHWEITGWLSTLMMMHAAKHSLGTAGGSELMVRLPNGRRVPDLLFVSNARRQHFHPTYFDGAPDLIVEVVSPDSQSRDRREKYLEYQSSGVQKYWIIDPASASAEFYQLSNGAYALMPVSDGVIRSQALAGFWLKVDWLWQTPLPNVYEVAKSIGIV